jgi:hypothetical protein
LNTPNPVDPFKSDPSVKNNLSQLICPYFELKMAGAMLEILWSGIPWISCIMDRSKNTEELA